MVAVIVPVVSASVRLAVAVQIRVESTWVQFCLSTVTDVALGNDSTTSAGCHGSDPACISTVTVMSSSSDLKAVRILLAGTVLATKALSVMVPVPVTAVM